MLEERKVILVIEDDITHWEYIREMLMAFGTERYDVIPDNKKVFNEIRDMINRIYSPKDDIKAEAVSYLSKTMNEKYDLIIMDYELHSENDSVNCIEICKKIDLKRKVLIYTKYVAHKLELIKESIKKNGYSGYMEVRQKPNELEKVYNLRDTYEYLHEAIRCMIEINQKNDNDPTILNTLK